MGHSADIAEKVQEAKEQHRQQVNLVSIRKLFPDIGQVALFD